MILFRTDKKRGASRKTCPSIVRGETSIYLIAPRLYGIFNVAITAITFLFLRPKGQPFKNFREQRFSVVVPYLMVQRYNFISYYQNFLRLFFFLPPAFLRPFGSKRQSRAIAVPRLSGASKGAPFRCLS